MKKYFISFSFETKKDFCFRVGMSVINSELNMENSEDVFKMAEFIKDKQKYNLVIILNWKELKK